MIDPSLVQRIAGGSQGGGGDVGQYASLARDAGGGQHIAYYDATFRRLKYAHRGGPTASWTIETPTTASLTGQYCALAVGAARAVVGSADLTLGSRTAQVRDGLVVSSLLIGGTFRAGSPPADYVIEAVDPAAGELTLATPYGGGTGTQMVFTATFYQPVISFQDGSTTRRLRVARPGGHGDWVFDVVDGPGVGSGSGFTGFDTSAALGSDGTIHVAYRDGATSGGATNQLRYAAFDGVQWTVTTPDTAPARGYGARIVVDRRNAPVILHRDNLNRTMLATFKDSPTTSTWLQAVIDAGVDTGLGISAAYFEPGDQVIVAYHEQVTSPTGDNKLKISTGDHALNSRQFTRDTVAEGIGVGDFSAVAHGATTGTLRLAYYDGGEQRLKALALGTARTPDANAMPTLLDGGADVGRYCSAIVDPAGGDLYAAYYDATGGALKIAHDDGVHPPDSAFVDGVKYGTDSAIGLTHTHVVVAYYAATERSLHLARWPRDQSPESSPAFVDIVLDDSSIHVGESVAMAIDDNDTIYLVYFDRARSALRGATIFSDWTYQTGTIVGPLDGVFVGESCDIAINRVGSNPPDKLAIVFYMLRNANLTEPQPTLYYGEATALPASNPGVYAPTFTYGPALLAQANAGRFCSVAYGPSDTIHVAYFDDNDLAPGYARIESGGNRSGGQLIEGSLFEHGGLETSIAINPASGEPAVAYYDITNAALKYAELAGDQWNVATVDDAGDTGHTPVLRFDASHGLARVLYYDQSAGRLRLATRILSDNPWQTSTLLGDTMGFHPALALDADGSLAMCFHQLSTGNLLTVLTAPLLPMSRADAGWLRLR
jgi:hypothetical protein